jgi:hypothetical protein
MTRQLEQAREDKQKKRDQAVLLLLEGGLEKAVEHAGGELTGFAVRLNGYDCLMTVKVVLAGKAQIAFVGAEDLTACLLKCEREAKADKLQWRADKYAK